MVIKGTTNVRFNLIFQLKKEIYIIKVVSILKIKFINRRSVGKTLKNNSQFMPKKCGNQTSTGKSITLA